MEAWMILLIVAVAILAALAVIYLVLIAPSRNKTVKKYKSVRFAHRGLHGEGVAENSLSAFAAAVDAGFGIELDVRLSRDGVLVVFHDDTLERVTDREGRVDAFSAQELAQIKLCGTEDGIPTFAQVLELVDGKVPLLVEIKEDPGVSAVSVATAQMLENYKGPYVVESFNPLSLATFARKAPRVPRGILSHRYYAYDKYRKPLYMLLQLLLLNRVCRPAFIAYDHRHYRSLSLRLCRLMGAVTYAWTVRSAEEEREARRHGFDSVIFEGYMPE